LVRVPARCCWPAPAGVADEDLVLTEPLAVAVRAVGRADVRSGETVAIVGAGTLGLLAVQVARGHGARILVVSRTARRFALARDLGAEATRLVADGTVKTRPLVSHRFPLDAIGDAFVTHAQPDSIKVALVI